MDPSTPPLKVAPRRRMRVSLRVMMLAILCLAVFLGWQVNKARQQREAVAAVRRHGGWVYYDFQMVDDKPVPGKQPWGPRWLRRALGDEYFQTVVSVNLYFDESDGSTPQNGDTRPCDDVLAFLATQHGLKSLNMLGSQATDAGLAYLRNATTLERLLLQDESIISDSGVANLRNLVNLKTLGITKSNITDEGLLSLSKLTKLKYLVLQDHPFSDRGLAAIQDMDGLEYLCIGGGVERRSKISDDGLKYVASKTHLTHLILTYSDVTDKGMRKLHGLSKLIQLNLDGCTIGDDAVRSLSGLENLRYLTLSGTNVSDKGLKYLERLPELLFLGLTNCKVSDEGKRTLRQFNPRISFVE